MVNKRIIVLFFAILIVSQLTLAAFPVVLGQGGTNVKGLLTADTVWTKAGSPYNVTGPTAVTQGVTLTIEPGVTVNFNGYYILVNGTLTAKGTPTDKVTLNGGQITFNAVSNGWKEQIQSGCLIQNAILNQITISNNIAVKIDGCTVNGDVSVAAATISNCIITGEVSVSSATLINCHVTGNIYSRTAIVSNCKVKGDISVGTVTLGG
jgi:hypothetical protein